MLIRGQFNSLMKHSELGQQAPQPGAPGASMLAPARGRQAGFAAVQQPAPIPSTIQPLRPAPGRAPGSAPRPAIPAAGAVMRPAYRLPTGLRRSLIFIMSGSSANSFQIGRAHV